MLSVGSRVTGFFPAVQWTLIVVGCYVQDHVLRRVQSKDLAGDPLEMIPESDPVRSEERDGEEVVLRGFGTGPGRCGCSFVTSVSGEQLLAL